MTPILPEKILAKDDPGDITQHRFRYQAAFGALMCLELMQNFSEFEEVFCELHEDILVRLKNRSFIGIQIKTRNDEKGNFFSVNDNEIKHALEKFIDHEKTFPNFFSKYELVTNCGFGNRRNGSNLDYIVKYIRDKNDLQVIKNNKIVFEYISKMALDNKVTDQYIIDLYKKIYTIKWVDLDRCDFEIVLSLRKNHNIVNIIEGENIANELIGLVLKASASMCENPRKKYFEIFNESTMVLTDMIIELKRINRNRIEEILVKLKEDQLKILVKNPLKIENIPKGLSIMEKKMVMGEIPLEYIERFQDNKNSLDYLLASWANKYGMDEAENRYNKIHKLVKDDCQDIDEIIDKNTNPYGKKLLLEIKDKIDITYMSYIKNSYQDCLPLHVLGDVSNLTQDCVLWFSEKFKVDSD